MELKLERPLLFFDIESTGLNIATDCIIELCFVKVLPDGGRKVKTWRVKPWDYAGNCQKPIAPSAEAVHGISGASLSACPRFFEIADEVVEWLADSDLAGFNSAKFDLPLLAEEIERARKYLKRNFNIDLHDKRMVDVQNIYNQMEPRNLKAAYKFYCGLELENAHSAEADTLATYEILKSQLDRYPEDKGDGRPHLRNDVGYLANFSERQKSLDYAGRLALNDEGEAVITFGKHRGKTAREVFRSEPSYFAWIENGEFTLDTKRQFALLHKKFDEEKRSRPLSGEELSRSIDMLNGKFSGSLF